MDRLRGAEKIDTPQNGQVVSAHRIKQTPSRFHWVNMFAVAVKLLVSSWPGRCRLWLLMMLVAGTCVSCTPGYRPQIPAPPTLSETELSDMAYEAIGHRTGAMIVVNPRDGRVIKRVSHGTDAQFVVSPFGLAQIVTAYAALEAGVIDDRTLLPCRQGGRVDVATALAHSCPEFFAQLSRRITPAQFTRAAAVVGFTYFGIESPTYDQTLIRPVSAKLPDPFTTAALTALAVKGEGMEARELHFAQLASSLASGVTASERFAAYIMASARVVAPPVVPFNQHALAVVRRGLLKAVEEGEAGAAAHPGKQVAGRTGSGQGQAIFISYAPATDPEIALVVYLKDATGQEAAEVAGKFYEFWFRQK